MYYEESVIDGVLHYRTKHNGLWRRVSDVQLTSYHELQKEEISRLNAELEQKDRALRSIADMPTFQNDGILAAKIAYKALNECKE